jgi:hypothetical protein
MNLTVLYYFSYICNFYEIIHRVLKIIRRIPIKGLLYKYIFKCAAFWDLGYNMHNSTQNEHVHIFLCA